MIKCSDKSNLEDKWVYLGLWSQKDGVSCGYMSLQGTFFPQITMVAQIYYDTIGERKQVDPWGCLASQPHLAGESLASEIPCLKTRWTALELTSRSPKHMYTKARCIDAVCLQQFVLLLPLCLGLLWAHSSYFLFLRMLFFLYHSSLWRIRSLRIWFVRDVLVN